MLRSILAVIAGYLAVAVLSVLADIAIAGTLPTTSEQAEAMPVPGTGLLVFMLGYSFLFGVTGGYVTATLARRSEFNHVLALGILMLVFGLMSMAAYFGVQPLWFQIALLLIIFPAVLLGGRLRAKRTRRTSQTPGQHSHPTKNAEH